jgi:hypothetical protein
MRGSIIVASAAGAALVLGAFVDWTGVDYSSHLDRTLAAVAGAVVIVLAAAALAWRRVVLALCILPGALGLNMGIVNVLDIERHRHEYAAYPDAAVGVGLYLVLVGGSGAVLVGLLAVREWRARTAP